MERGSRDEIGKKEIGLVGPWRTWVKNSDFVLNINGIQYGGQRGKSWIKNSLVHIFQEEPGCYFGKSRQWGADSGCIWGYEPLGFLFSLDVGCDQNEHQQWLWSWEPEQAGDQWCRLLKWETLGEWEGSGWEEKLRILFWTKRDVPIYLTYKWKSWVCVSVCVCVCVCVCIHIHVRGGS